MEEVKDEDADSDSGAGAGAAKTWEEKRKKNSKEKKVSGEEGTTASPGAKSITSPGTAASMSSFHIPVGTTEARSGHSYLMELGGAEKQGMPRPHLHLLQLDQGAEGPPGLRDEDSVATIPGCLRVFGMLDTHWES